jgi:hypothetical protein
MPKLMDSHVINPIDLKLDQLVAKTLETFHVAGLSLAIIHGENIWEKVGELHTPYIMVH